MNKKLIVLILFVFMLLSIVLISLLGAQPAPPTPRVEKIEFVDENNEVVEKIEIDISTTEKNEDGKYVITLQLNCVVTPSNAVDKRIEIKVLNDGSNDEIVEIVDISSDGLVTITLDSLVGINIPIIATCVDRDANFYGKKANIEIILKTKTGSDSDIIL